MAATDLEVLLASIAGLQVSHNIAIDGELMRVLGVPATAATPVPVLRGTRGTNVTSHPAGAAATYGPPVDFGGSGRQQRRDVISVSANGNIPNPVPGTDRIVMINGTTALTTLVLTNPTKDADGDMLFLISNGKGAHVVTYTTSGLGGGGAASDVLTFSTVAQMSAVFIAANELWVLVGGASGAGAVAGAPVIT
jgi:hypothetical protein